MSMDRQLEMENGSNARRRNTLCEKESLYYIYTLCFGGMSAVFCFGTALTGWQALRKSYRNKYIVQLTISLVNVIMKSARSIGGEERLHRWMVAKEEFEYRTRDCKVVSILFACSTYC